MFILYLYNFEIGNLYKDFLKDIALRDILQEYLHEIFKRIQNSTIAIFLKYNNFNRLYIQDILKQDSLKLDTNVVKRKLCVHETLNIYIRLLGNKDSKL